MVWSAIVWLQIYHTAVLRDLNKTSENHVHKIFIQSNQLIFEIQTIITAVTSCFCARSLRTTA